VSYFNSIQQNVVADANNGVTVAPGGANLAVNAIWAGLASSTLGVAGIQVNIACDQNCTVYIEQAGSILPGIGTVTTNGTTTLAGSGTKFLRDFKVGDQIWITGETVRVITAIASDISLTVSSAFSTSSGGLAFTQYYWYTSDEFHYYVGLSSGYGDTITAVASVVRVRVQNIGMATTTYLRVETALCPIVPALPRALSAEGNLKVGVYEIEGDLGVRAEITPNNELRTSSPVRVIGSTFPGATLDANFWTAAVAGTTAGVVSQTGGVLSLTASAGTATVGSTASIQSARTARYVAGASLQYQSICRCPAVTGTNTRRWGAFNTTDGFFFEHDGTTLSLVCRIGSADTNKISSGSFNGQYGTTYVLPVNTAVSCKIHWNTKKAWFLINDMVVHTFEGTITPLVSEFSMPCRAECNNANANTNANVFNCRSASIRRFGLPNTRPFWKNQVNANSAATILKRSPGTLQKLVVNSWVDGGTVTLYDAITATNPIGSILFSKGEQSSITPVTIPYDLDFYTGLCWTVTGTGMDVTVVYE
jgi:hypothetical protein